MEVDPYAFADVIRGTVRRKTQKLYDRTFRTGTVSTINSDVSCNVLVEGSTTPTQAIICVSSYTPRPGDKVLLLSAGESGADLMVFGPVGPPIGEYFAPTFTNGFANLDPALGYGPAQYSKDAQGFVHMRGTIIGPNNAAPYTLSAFTLPTGYRPVQNAAIPVVHGYFSGVVRIYTDGRVEPTIQYNSSSFDRWVGLNGIHFRAGGS